MAASIAAPSPSSILVCYHYPCPDGIFAALAAHLHFERRGGPQPRWVPNRVYAPVKLSDLNLKGDETLYLLDFVGPPGFARLAAEATARVIVLDHHKTAAEHLGPATGSVPNLEIHLDMGRSGATIARDYFSPLGLTPPQQELFAFIEDADLWRWALPESKAFHSGFCSLGLEMDANVNPGIWQQLLQLSPTDVIARGHVELRKQQVRIAAALETSFEVELGGQRPGSEAWGRCLAVRAEGLSELRSQLGNSLAEKSQSAGFRAVAVVAYIEEAMGDASQIKVSLRSIGDEDTTVVTQAYGGGGHRNASSCVIPISEFVSWSV